VQVNTIIIVLLLYY